MRNTFYRGISILFLCVVASAVRKLARGEGRGGGDFPMFYGIGRKD